MVEMDDALKIGIIVILIAFASAIVTWDPRILFPEYSESEVGVKGDKDLAALLELNVTSINWGLLEPGNFAERGLLIENLGKAPGVLSIQAGNFTPVAAEQFMNLSWNLAPGVSLQPGKSVAATLRLAVSPLVQNITDFSFDITILVTALPEKPG